MSWWNIKFKCLESLFKKHNENIFCELKVSGLVKNNSISFPLGDSPLGFSVTKYGEEFKNHSKLPLNLRTHFQLWGKTLLPYFCTLILI